MRTVVSWAAESEHERRRTRREVGVAGEAARADIWEDSNQIAGFADI